ncbi:hypothetical protein ANRL3_02713 [Anaerolineae bacterium]|nr:hypothetical protein ANRL3_02713 [Anaerolineae bacterium]
MRNDRCHVRKITRGSISRSKERTSWLLVRSAQIMCNLG